MLDLSQPPTTIGSATIFPDHADESVFYVTTSAPVIAKDPETGSPLLGLTLYRDGASGIAGGLLQLEIVLADIDEDGIRDWLRQGGVANPQLYRPAWRRAKVSLGGWLDTSDDDEESHLDPVTLGVGQPSLLPDGRAVIVAQLDPTAAAFAHETLREGGLATAVWYELETLGLGGPLGIVVEADMSAIYDKMSAQGALVTPYGRARLAKAWEDFVNEGLVTVEIHDESLASDHAKIEALRRSAEAWIAELFQPAPPKASAATLDPSNPTMGVTLQFLLRQERETSETHARWSYTERSPLVLHHRPQAGLMNLLGQTDPNTLIRRIDIEPAAHDFTVRSIDPMSPDGVESLSVTVRWGWTPPTDDEPESLPAASLDVSLSPDAPQVVSVVESSPRERFHYRVQAHFDPTAGEIPPQTTDWLEAGGGVLPISSRRLFPARTVDFALIGADFSWQSLVRVDVRCADRPTRTLVLDASTGSGQVVFLALAGQSVAVEAEWQGMEGEPSRTATLETDEDLVQLVSPFGPSLPITLLPPRDDTIDSVVAELRYTDPSGFTDERQVEWFAPELDARTVSLRTLADGPRTWELRTTTTTLDGQLQQTDWAVHDTLAVFLGEGEMEPRNVEVVLLEGSPSALGLAAIEIRLEDPGTGVRAKHLFEGDEDQKDLLILVPPHSPSATWTVTVRRFGADGSVSERQLEAEGSLVPVVWGA